MSLAVLMPVYNAEKYLVECINSILNQTYGDFQLFPCDDGSNDGSWQILQEFAKLDNRVKPFKNQKNCGIVATRNFLLDSLPMDTTLVAWMDADDVCFPHRFQKQIDYLAAHPEVAGVGGNLEIIDEKSCPTGVRHYPLSPQEIRKRLPISNVLAQPAMMIRYEVIKATGKYSQTCPVCQDYEYWLRVLEHYDFANLPDYLLHYRISSTQVKQTKLKQSLATTMRIQRNYFRRIGKFMGFKGICYQIAGHMLLCIPAQMILQIFCILTYRKKSAHTPTSKGL